MLLPSWMTSLRPRLVSLMSQDSEQKILLTNNQVWKGSKDKKDQLEDEASWNKLARFSSFPHFFFIFLIHTWVILLFCQAAVEILGDHEGAMGPVRGHLE